MKASVGCELVALFPFRIFPLRFFLNGISYVPPDLPIHRFTEIIIQISPAGVLFVGIRPGPKLELHMVLLEFSGILVVEKELCGFRSKI
jgi:hypothetical protein